MRRPAADCLAVTCQRADVGLYINKKFELMLTRRAKAYSSSGSRKVNIQKNKFSIWIT